MIMAINFYTGLIDTSGTPQKEASAKVRLASVNALSAKATEIRGTLGPQIDEIQWWISKALSWLPPFTGMATRSDKYDQDLLNYFEPGKVF